MRRFFLLAAVSVIAAAAAFAVPQSGTGFDGARAYEHVRQIVGFGPRPPGSAALDATRRYIRAQLGKIGIESTEQAFDADTPLGRFRMVNLIGRIPGGAPGRLLVGGHYETKLFRDFRFVGANDGGSSAAFLIELGRVLKARKNRLTIELVFFDGEEALRPEWGPGDHTYGSRHYVAAARRAGALPEIKALILVDMIGDRDLRILREQASTPWLTDLLWASARRLKLSTVFVDETTPIEDDHVPFLEAGIPAVDIIDLDYPPWHTPADTLDNVSARSLQMVGDVVLGALPAIEARLVGPAK